MSNLNRTEGSIVSSCAKYDTLGVPDAIYGLQWMQCPRELVKWFVGQVKFAASTAVMSWHQAFNTYDPHSKRFRP